MIFEGNEQVEKEKKRRRSKIKRSEDKDKEQVRGLDPGTNALRKESIIQNP